MNTDELKIEVCDIETYRAMFLFCGYDIQTKEKFQYEISFRRNDLYALVKHLKDYPRWGLCTFNGVSFDGQVLQFILDNYKKWHDKEYHEIVKLIATFAERIIEDQDYDMKPPYREHYLDFKQIDCFKVLHYDNDARKVGLKWAFEFSLDGDIEELPIDSKKPILTEEEIESVIEYCWNDVFATLNGYNVCLGKTDHPDYKGKNKIQLRLDLIEEFKLPHTAVNWNDVKIGTELNKKNYMELARIGEDKLWEKVRNRKTRSGFLFKECFPHYARFETKEFKDFIKKVGNTRVNLNEKQEFPFHHRGVNYMFAKGGGHSVDRPRQVKIPKGWMLMDADVGSMYPRLIEKLNIYPAHLGPVWNQAYVSNIPRRLEAKKKYKETREPKYDNLQECFKLVLNGNFGKLGDRHDWQYDPFAMLCTTAGGQIDIFMLAEDFVMAGFQIISMNTDGLTVLIPEDRVQEYYQICKAWEREVGNDVRGRLEYVEYELFAQTSVNDYIAVKKSDWKDEDGTFRAYPINKPMGHKDKVKKKGDFLTYYELHKNKSKSIIPIALEQFFTKGVPVVDTVEEHRNIFDFCIARKASKDYRYKSIDRKTGKQTDLNKLVRYYCAISPDKQLKKHKAADTKQKINALKYAGWIQGSDGKWSDPASLEDDFGFYEPMDMDDAYQQTLPVELVPGKLYKIKNEFSDKPGPAQSNCETDSNQQVLFNRPFKKDRWSDFGIDYSYYIRQTNKIIDKILPEYKRDRIILEKKQLQLF
jgi:hypothetical protein